MEGIKITPPNISDKTMEEMVRFFMKTSIPRILEERKESNDKKCA